jgi:hypothetical protein
VRNGTTYTYRSVTLTSYTGGEEGNNDVLSPFGPLKAGLTTWQRTDRDHQLTELLNSLEKQVEILTNRSLKVLNISLTGTTHLVTPTDIFYEGAGTE